MTLNGRQLSEGVARFVRGLDRAATTTIDELAQKIAGVREVELRPIDRAIIVAALEHAGWRVSSGVWRAP
jgi:hypothetical protein